MRSVFLFLYVCLFSLCNSALATPITFDFSIASDSFIYSEFGLGLAVSADSVDDALSIGGEVDWSSFGLGVVAGGGIDSSKTMDGSGSDDLLMFDFSVPVLLQKVVFSRVGDSDEVQLWVQGLKVFDDYIDRALTTSLNVVELDFSAMQLAVGSFSLLALDSNDSFRVKSITVDHRLQPLATPEPATWLLLSAGVCGLLFLRRWQ